MRFSKQIVYVNAFQLKMGRDPYVGFITCHRGANHTPVRGSKKEIVGFGFVSGDWGRSKGKRTVSALDAIRKRGKSMSILINLIYKEGRQRLSLVKKHQSLR